MTEAALKRMTVPEFVAWAERQPRGRYELVHGFPVAMAPQRIEHADAKGLAFLALRTAILRAGLTCHAVPDGLSVCVDDETVYEPDASSIVAPGCRTGPSLWRTRSSSSRWSRRRARLSIPATSWSATFDKLVGYFKVPSVAHYLIVHPLQRVVTHHARGSGDLIETRIKADGELHLDPPRLALTVAELLPAP
jgi:Uma2 family endonuclease